VLAQHVEQGESRGADNARAYLRDHPVERAQLAKVTEWDAGGGGI